MTGTFRYNVHMSQFRMYTSIQVRYGDLDPQWHVNNTRFLSFMEEARVEYLLKLGLWDGRDFFSVGLIVADIHVAYLAPIDLLHRVRVGIRTGHIGNKSLRFDYVIEDEDSGKTMATGETVMVAYDYRSQTSMPVPAHWRETISAFEGKTF